MGPRRPNTTRPGRPGRPPRPRRGPIAAARRGLALSAAGLSIAIVLAWGLGVVLNDRFLWSQWLWWIPTLPVAIAAGITVGMSRFFDRHTARIARRIAFAGVLFTLLAIVIEARPLNAFTPGPADRPPAGSMTATPISVAYWNLSWAPSAPAATAIAEGRLAADVLVIANPRPGRGELASAIADRYAAPPPADPLMQNTGPTFIARVNLTTIASRFPIRAHGRAPLSGFKTAWNKARLSNVEAGVIFVELDHPDAGRVTLWIVDLPSDPTVHRRALMARMARDIDNWNRFVTKPDGIGRWRTQPDDTRDGFPRPDIVVGDFNTPRASRSLHTLVGEATDAHTAISSGFAHTWPRPVPLWAIDLAFTSPYTADPVAFDVIDPGHSLHHAIRVTAALSVTPPRTSDPPTTSPPDP